jgi:hypothetical protein
MLFTTNFSLFFFFTGQDGCSAAKKYLKNLRLRRNRKSLTFSPFSPSMAAFGPSASPFRP